VDPSSLDLSGVPSTLLPALEPLLSQLAKPIRFRDQWTSQLQVSVVQPITPLYSVHHGHQAAREGEVAARHQREQSQRETTYRASEAYYRLLTAQHLHQVAVESVATLTAHLEQDMEDIANGKTTLPEVVEESQDMLSDILEVMDKNKQNIGDEIRQALHEQSGGRRRRRVGRRAEIAQGGLEKIVGKLDAACPDSDFEGAPGACGRIKVSFWNDTIERRILSGEHVAGGELPGLVLQLRLGSSRAGTHVDGRENVFPDQPERAVPILGLW